MNNENKSQEIGTLFKSLSCQKKQEPKTTKTWIFIYLRQSDAPSPEFKLNSLIIIYQCMLLHFLCSQNNKYSCETLQCCYNKHWYHMNLCRCHIRQCLQETNKFHFCIINLRCTLLTR